jgi:hypothetical protein
LKCAEDARGVTVEREKLGVESTADRIDELFR